MMVYLNITALIWMGRLIWMFRRAGEDNFCECDIVSSMVFANFVSRCGCYLQWYWQKPMSIMRWMVMVNDQLISLFLNFLGRSYARKRTGRPWNVTETDVLVF